MLFRISCSLDKSSRSPKQSLLPRIFPIRILANRWKVLRVSRERHPNEIPEVKGWVRASYRFQRSIHSIRISLFAADYDRNALTVSQKPLLIVKSSSFPRGFLFCPDRLRFGRFVANSVPRRLSKSGLNVVLKVQERFAFQHIPANEQYKYTQIEPKKLIRAPKYFSLYLSKRRDHFLRRMNRAFFH